MRTKSEVARWAMRKPSPTNEREEAQHQDDAEEAELFGDRGEDHVRGNKGNVARLTESEAGARDTAGGDGEPTVGAVGATRSGRSRPARG